MRKKTNKPLPPPRVPRSNVSSDGGKQFQQYNTYECSLRSVVAIRARDVDNNNILLLYSAPHGAKNFIFPLLTLAPNYAILFFFFFAVIHPLRFVFYRRYFHPTDEHTLHSCCSHLSRKTAGIWIYVRYSCRITARTSRGFRKRSCARFMAVVFLSRIGMNAPSPLTHAKSKLLLFNSQQLYSKRKRSRFNENIIVK